MAKLSTNGAQCKKRVTIAPGFVQAEGVGVRRGRTCDLHLHIA